MFRIGSRLTASVAVALLAAQVSANDGNSAYLDQQGEGNSALIFQDIPGFSQDLGGNDFGTAATPALQRGDDNRMVFSNGLSFPANAGNGDNDVGDARQIGDDNATRILASAGATGGRILNTRQRGNGNVLSIRQTATNAAQVNRAVQDGDDNTMLIVQGRERASYSGNGADNKVRLARQTGDGNGGVARRSGIYIQQNGRRNLVTRATVEGDNNRGAISIVQRGQRNGRGLSEAIMIGSDGNRIDILQDGRRNDFGVYQGASVGDTGNVVELTQTGRDNRATLSQFGSDNELRVEQTGDANTVNASFTGSGNGVGRLTGVAGTLVATSGEPDFFQGNIFQDSAGTAGGNTIDYSVTGSNNLFAFAQIGASNSITGTVGSLGASNGNQGAVIQTGSGNATTFVQNGGNNNLAVSQ